MVLRASGLVHPKNSQGTLGKCQDSHDAIWSGKVIYPRESFPKPGGVIPGLNPFSSMKDGMTYSTVLSVPLDQFRHSCSQNPGQGTPQECPPGFLSVPPTAESSHSSHDF